MCNSPILDIKNISAFYGSLQAIRNVSLTVQEKEIVTIIGANGAGKSTLLMNIFSSPSPTEGGIFFRGENITAIASYKISSLGIAQVPEGRRIFPKMTVRENILLGIRQQQMNIEEEIEKIFHIFPILKKRHTQYAGTLSGGEQQMLAIGRALVSRPQLLLLDEPSLGLAPILVTQIFNKLSEINEQGTAILLVEQNAFHALKISHRGYVLVNGEVKITGSSSQLFNNPEVKEAYLGGH